MSIDFRGSHITLPGSWLGTVPVCGPCRRGRTWRLRKADENQTQTISGLDENDSKLRSSGAAFSKCLMAFSASAVWLAAGAFLMQVMVQGAWGVIPVHLNELSPADTRGTFPRFTYQLGNLIASVNATLQAGIAAHYNNDYAFALALVAGIVAVVIVILTVIGVEAKGVSFDRAAAEAEASPSVSPAA